MGIRYYASPVPAEHLGAAIRSLDDYLGSDERHQFIRHRDPLPPELTLDTMWRPMRFLLEARPPASGSAAALQLVAGDVEWGCCGYRPHLDLLDDEQVAAIALDLARPELDGPCPAEVCTEHLRQKPTSADRTCGDHHYLTEMLQRARSFTAELSARGWGLLYSIG